MGNNRKEHRPRSTSSKKLPRPRSRSRSRSGNSNNQKRRKSPSPEPKKSPKPQQNPQVMKEKLPIDRKTFDNPETLKLKNWKAAKAAAEQQNFALAANVPTLPQPQEQQPRVNIAKPISKPVVNVPPPKPEDKKNTSKSVNTHLKIKPNVAINENTFGIKERSNALEIRNLRLFSFRKQPEPAPQVQNNKKRQFSLTETFNKRLFGIKNPHEEVVGYSQPQKTNVNLLRSLSPIKSLKAKKSEPEPVVSVSRWKLKLGKSSHKSIVEEIPTKKKKQSNVSGTFLKRGVRRGVWAVAKRSIRNNENWQKRFAENGITNIDNINVDYVNADLIDVDGLGIENKLLKRTVTWLLK